MKTLIVVLALMLVLMGASIVWAGCDASRWTDPRNAGRFLSCGENMYVALDAGGINADGNIQIATTTLLNQKDGICQIDIVWEISCERQEVRVLQTRAYYDSDYPTAKDYKQEGDKIWISYNSTMPIGRAADQFCGRKNSLPKF